MSSFLDIRAFQIPDIGPGVKELVFVRANLTLPSAPGIRCFRVIFQASYSLQLTPNLFQSELYLRPEQFVLDITL
jgi:hypothetical protein